MPRRAAAQIRPIEPDAVHRNRLVQQVINKVMLDGKKSTAEKIVYDALAILAERSGKNPVEPLEAGVKALTPVLEVRSRRVGGATYQVPVEVPARRARTLAVRWLVSSPASGASTDGPAPRQRAARRPAAAGQRLQAQGRHLPDGAGQQGVRPLPLVASTDGTISVTCPPPGPVATQSALGQTQTGATAGRIAAAAAQTTATSALSAATAAETGLAKVPVPVSSLAATVSFPATTALDTDEFVGANGDPLGLVALSHRLRR